ncbi:MAG TPA: acylphosphatase [Paenalcaligenes sp.]|nr:acylphosphatase [Paenalcaligenes sp.]
MSDDFTMFRATVFGRVQGVGFRAATVQQARLYNVTGWVRNAVDGTVEVLAQGAADDIDKFLSWLHKGPVAARVDRVEVIDGDLTEKRHQHFEWR